VGLGFLQGVDGLHAWDNPFAGLKPSGIIPISGDLELVCQNGLIHDLMKNRLAELVDDASLGHLQGLGKVVPAYAHG
jgi:hypothetical protein